jgi:hypothetical protein
MGPAKLTSPAPLSSIAARGNRHYAGGVAQPFQHLERVADDGEAFGATHRLSQHRHRRTGIQCDGVAGLDEGERGLRDTALLTRLRPCTGKVGGIGKAVVVRRAQAHRAAADAVTGAARCQRIQIATDCHLRSREQRSQFGQGDHRLLDEQVLNPRAAFLGKHTRLVKGENRGCKLLA